MNKFTLQGAVSIATLLCLVVGWFQLFSPEINDFIYRKLFYILIGVSFYFSAQAYPIQNHKYLGYLAAGLCVVGVFVPTEFGMIKTVGLLGGIVLSFIAKSRS